jgi:N-acetylglutamate synthase-like GNAT family acetyltransferase
MVAELSAYAAKVKDSIIGFISFADLDEAAIIVALGILPKYQNSGVGKSLVEKVENEAKTHGKKNCWFQHQMTIYQPWHFTRISAFKFTK